MTLIVKDLTRPEFEKRVQSVLEEFTGSPIVNKRQSKINKALVGLLHGDGSLTNHKPIENNLDLFFSSESSAHEFGAKSVWISFDDYHTEKYGDSAVVDFHDSESKAVEHIHRETVSFLRGKYDSIGQHEHERVILALPDSTREKLEKDLDSSLFGVLEDKDVSEEFVIALLDQAEPYVIELVFELLTALDDVYGSHRVVRAQLPEKETKPAIISTISIIVKIFEADFNSDELYVDKVWDYVSSTDINGEIRQVLNDLFVHNRTDEASVNCRKLVADNVMKAKIPAVTREILRDYFLESWEVAFDYLIKEVPLDVLLSDQFLECLLERNHYNEKISIKYNLKHESL